MARFVTSKAARAALIGLGLVALAAAAAPPARAQSSNAAPAKEAYDRGSAAYRKGDYAAAAHEYARADELAPNDVALQAGLEAAVLSDELVLGMELLERSRRGEATGKLAKAIKAARDKFKGRAGQVRVSCGDKPCTARVDGVPIEPRSTRWVKVGPHRVAIEVGAVSDEQLVEVRADELTEVQPATRAAPLPAPSAEGERVAPQPEAPAATAIPEPPAQPARKWRLAPHWFWLSTAATGILGGGAVYYAFKASSEHDTFKRNGCPTLYSESCAELADRGATYDMNVDGLITFAAISAAATGVVGIWFVDWGSEARPSGGRAGLTLGPGHARLHGTF
jgi:tetratricopeptide (TPR) repeat protein